jgi:hypothetical protein
MFPKFYLFSSFYKELKKKTDRVSIHEKLDDSQCEENLYATQHHIP